MNSGQDRAFWLAVYRGLMAIAAAIKRYKLKKGEDNEAGEVDIAQETE